MEGGTKIMPILKPEEFQQKTAEIIANLTDQSKVTSLLTEITEHNTELVAGLATASKEVADKTAYNDKLLKANMDLFLKVGNNKDNTQTQQQQNEEKPSFDALFDNKGNLL
jgi:gamma-glutamyl:cysteine ligase YbdK (ATP-grasp superfamily)